MKKIILILLVGLTNICALAQTCSSVTLTNSGDGASLLNFNTERPWVFKQVGTGAYTNLQLHNSPGPNKHFQVKTNGGIQLVNQSDDFNSFLSANGGNSYVGNLGGNLGIGTNAPLNRLDLRLSSNYGHTARFAEVNGAGIILGVNPNNDDPLSGYIGHTSTNRNINYEVFGIGKHFSSQRHQLFRYYSK